MKRRLLAAATRRAFDAMMHGAELDNVSMLAPPVRSAHGASRISELVALGVPITKRTETIRTVDGRPAHIKKYSIKPEDRRAARAVVDGLNTAASPAREDDPPAPAPPGQATLFNVPPPATTDPG